MMLHPPCPVVLAAWVVWISKSSRFNSKKGCNALVLQPFYFYACA
jgi:hypothetical protein